MAYCSKCGAPLSDNPTFCSRCGAPQATAYPPNAVQSASPSGVVVTPVPATRAQMDEKIAGLLAYLLGWVTGIVFFLIDKRSFVRFHAAQSIVVFGGLQILLIILGLFSGLSLFTAGASGFSLGWVLSRLIELLAFVLWVVLMIKAYQGDKFRIPVAADIAQRIFGTN